MPLFRSQLNDYDRMAFGKYKGELLMDIPNHYFRWLSEQEWLKDWPALARYVEAHDWGDDEDNEPQDEY